MYFGTVHEYIKSTESCSKFAKLVEEAGPSVIPKSTGSKTLFVPNNSAFEKLTDDDLSSIEENPKRLVSSLLYLGDLCTAGMFHISELKTVEGAWSITLGQENELIIGDTARLVDVDMVCSDGVVHIIDTVLINS